jgi:predicted acyl esterase
VLTLRKADQAALPAGQLSEIAVPLYYQGHAYRAGSRIRVTISAPGGDQPLWSFAQTTPTGRATIAVARSRAMPSRLVLPTITGVDVPTGLPPCPSLRGEACRPYRALANRSA